MLAWLALRAVAEFDDLAGPGRVDFEPADVQILAL